MRRVLASALFVLCCHVLSAQQPLTQVLRGSVVDKQVKNALVGATVVVTPSDPTRGAYTDASGAFRFDAVPVGTYAVTVTYLGYKPSVLPNVVINSGKETVLVIEMEESVVKVKEVVITADKRKDQSINEMSVVSTRTFSVEETQHYAAAVNDPSRMVTSYAGVVSPDDGNNKIAIRGNSPNGLLWRMEGIDIPNPNHFSNVGTSGGGISILSSALLSNSDFSTGAFAAEYGNALSGVFDLKLRKGNNEKREYTAKASVLGLSLASEGPFRKGYGGSYLVNYRYSTLGILSKMKVLGEDYSTTFQDLSCHVYLPTKKAGYFSLFGFGGLSNQRDLISKDSAQWKSEYDRYGGKFFSNTGAAGIAHGFIFNSKAYLKSAVAFSTTGNGYDTEYLDDEYESVLLNEDNYDQQKLAASTVFNYKFNPKLSLRSGLVQTRWSYGLLSRSAPDPDSLLQTRIDENDFTFTTQAFSQLQYRITDNLSINVGAHGLYLWLNETYSVEPRASVQWDFTDKQSIAVGYGLHSQVQPIGTYFSQRVNESGVAEQTNRTLDFTKAHHAVLSYNHLLTESFRLKTEVYYQRLFDVPVAKDSATSFSILNQTEGFVQEALTNSGSGKNYGGELTLEKFMSNRSYFLLSLSIYESKYKGSDGVERDTKYNGNYMGSFTGGKEFVLSKNSENTGFGVNVKVLYSGGFRYSPIDLEKSIVEEITYRDEANAFSQKHPDYFRVDAGVSLKLNRPKLTSVFSIDVQNSTNRKNIYSYFYDPAVKGITTSYQTGLIPVLAYQVQF